MTARTPIRPTFSAMVTIGVAGALMLIATQADARRGGKQLYYDQYDAGRSARGYEGFLFPGFYCSYRRYPRRVCTYDKRGRETCRVKGWRIEQTCE